MSVIESFRVALRALRSNKLRALLTMLGIIIGVASVIGLLAIGTGLSKFFDGQFNKIGGGVIYIGPGRLTRQVSASQVSQLTAADAEAIMQPGAVPQAAMVAIEFSSSATVTVGGNRYTYTVNGASPSFFQIGSNDLVAGRYYTQEEDRDRVRVAVITQKMAERLFGSAQAAVGQRLAANGVGFDIVGVLAAKDDFGPSQGEVVYVPYGTARSRLFRNQLTPKVDVGQLSVKVKDRDKVDELVEQVTRLLRERHRLTYQDNDFTIVSLDQIAATFQGILAGFRIFLGVIAGISLLVGGIGIMNIMLVSVAERTREIGLRKAVGARRSDILVQFLVEALVLCLIGALIGVLLGSAFSALGTYVLVNLMEADGAEATVTVGSILLATGVASGIGVLFGFFPALQAARLHPIEALRYE